MLHHPRNRAERRRIKQKKDYGKTDRELAVQQRLEQEAFETKQAIEELRLPIPHDTNDEQG